jgi:hypothetical protein
MMQRILLKPFARAELPCQLRVKLLKLTSILMNLNFSSQLLMDFNVLVGLHIVNHTIVVRLLMVFFLLHNYICNFGLNPIIIMTSAVGQEE